jgi:acetylornithine deacetylase
MQVLRSSAETDLTFATAECISLLKELIAIPSFSKEENATASLIQKFLSDKNIYSNRKLNNVWTVNKHFDSTLSTILLNSHHDTVKPADSYTRDPFSASVEGEKLFGLGSNDAGGSLVSLLGVFMHFYGKKDLKYNLVFAATAEEEISGSNGIVAIIQDLQPVDFAIVGEPTGMQLAIAEKGLLVLDCVAHGISGHAARNEGENAIYKALKDIEWFRNFSFPKVSATLGEIKMNVTLIKAGQQHNVIPSSCEFTVDIRTTDAYTNQEVLDIVRQHTTCDINPRSLRLQPSNIPTEHPFVQAGIKLGRKTYGSPTLSDQALMPWSSVKIGPGDSARSHTADEFIYLHEIKEGIELYIKMLSEIIL